MILTNQHLVGRATGVVDVFDAEGLEYRAQVVGRDSVLDLAVLRICCSENFERLPFAGSDPSPGDAVFVIGYRMGTTNLGLDTRGINFVVEGTQGRPTELRLDGAMNPGQSGGPMMDTLGRIVALTAYRARPSASTITIEDYGVGVSVETIRGRLADLKSGETHYVPVPTPCPDVMCGTFTSSVFGYEIEVPDRWRLNAGAPTKVSLWNPSMGNVIFIDVEGIDNSYADVEELLDDRTLSAPPDWNDFTITSESDIARNYRDSTELVDGHEFTYTFRFEGEQWAGTTHWFISKTAGINRLYQVNALARLPIVERTEFTQVNLEIRRVLVSFGPPKPF